MSDYIHARTCVYNINYHIIWCVKYRRKVLNAEIADTLTRILKGIGNEKGFCVVEARVGEMDHVHCFVSAPPTIPISDIVRCLKGASSRLLFSAFPKLRKHLWKGHLWNGSYFVETIGSTSESNILRYIEQQKSF